MILSMVRAVVLLSVIGGTTSLELAGCDSTQDMREFYPEADVQLAAVVSLHSSMDGLRCGEVIPSSLQPVEAMHWALGLLNQQDGHIGNKAITDSYIPGMTIGMAVADSCSLPIKATHAAVDLFPEILRDPQTCSSEGSKIILGAIISGNMDTTTSVVSMMSERGLPTVSYSTASVDDRDSGRLYVQTSPSAVQKAQVIVSIIERLQWTAFSLLWEPDEERQALRDSLLYLAAQSDLCVTRIVELATSTDNYPVHVGDILSTGVTGIVYLGSTATARRLFATLDSVDGAGNLQWIMDDIALDDPAIIGNEYTKGIVTLSPVTRVIPEFENFWVSKEASVMENSTVTYFTDWYMSAYRCILPGIIAAGEPFASFPQCEEMTEAERRANYRQEVGTHPAILAVYSLAKALKTAHATLCGSLPGVCPRLKELTQSAFYQRYLLTVDFTFSSEERIPSLASSQIQPSFSAQGISFNVNGDVTQTRFAIWNLKQVGNAITFQKVGAFADMELDMDTQSVTFYDEARSLPLNTPVMSRCPPDGCVSCGRRPSAAEHLMYTVIPGDLFIASTFSIHKSGEYPLSCGHIDGSDGVQMLEAFIYALGKIKTANILNPGVQLGGFALDDCTSAEKASNHMLNIAQHVTNIKHENNVVNPENIIGFFGGHTDTIASSVGNLASKLNKAFLSYRASGRNEAHVSSYPHLLEHTKVVETILKRMHWDYIQVIHTNNSYGQMAKAIFAELALKSKICIASFIDITETTRAEDVVNDLASSRDAKVVVTFVHEEFYSALVRTLDSTRIYNEYMFITDPNWRNMDEVIMQHNLASQAFVVLTYEDGTSQGFLEYLGDLSPSNAGNNPWYKEWYQELNNCYVDDKHQGDYAGQCGSSPVTDSQSFRLNERTIFVMNGLFAMAHGLNTALQKYCGMDYVAVCNNFMERASTEDILTKEILTSSFIDETGSIFSFNGKSGNRSILVQGISNGTLSVVGEYHFDTDTLFLRDDDIVFNIPNQFSSTCTGTCTECIYLEHIYLGDVMMIEGDLIIGAVINIHDHGVNPFECTSLKLMDSVQFAEALRYALNIINGGHGPVQLRGLTLGGVVLDGCESGIRAADIISNVHFQMLEPSINVDVDDLIAWITAGKNVTEGTDKVIKALGLPHVAVNYDKQQNNTISLSKRADAFEVNAAVLSFLHKAGLNNIQVVSAGEGRMIHDLAKEHNICILRDHLYGTDSDAEDIISQLLAFTSDVVYLAVDGGVLRDLLRARADAGERASRLLLLTVLDNPEELDGMTFDRLRRLLVLHTQPTLQSDNFDEYLTRLRTAQDVINPWLVEYYQALHDCNLFDNDEYAVQCDSSNSLSITDLADYEQNTGVTEIISSIFVISAALNATLRRFCGENYHGICSALSDPMVLRLEMMKAFQDLTVTDEQGRNVRFDGDGRHIQEYTFSGYNSRGVPYEIASYSKGELLFLLDDWNSFGEVSAECGNQCEQCVYHPVWYQLTEGDIYIAGLFDVHQSGHSPFSCGLINMDHGYQLVEAFNYAVDIVNRKEAIFSDKLEGIVLGSITLDMCKDPLNVVPLLKEVHGVNTENALILNLGMIPRIAGYTGGFDTDSSVYAAQVLTELGIPQVSYGAPATEWMGVDDNPTFFRTTPGDASEAHAIVALLQALDVNYVQVVFSDTTYGNSAFSFFRKKAQDAGICIVKNTSCSRQMGAQSMLRVVNLLADDTEAVVVIVLLERNIALSFLDSVSKQSKARTDLKFIVSQSLGQASSIAGLDYVVQNIITLAPESVDIPGFNQYMDAKKPKDTDSWFRHYYEDTYQCSLTNDHPRYTTICPNPPQNIVEAGRYHQDSYALHVMNAVFASALALHDTLSELCGEGSGVCLEYDQSTTKHIIMKQKLRTVEFPDASGHVFRFQNDGSSNLGYHIYTLEASNGSYAYTRVGSYNDSHHLNMQADFRTGWSSKCDSACRGCVTTQEKFRSGHASLLSPVDLNILSFLPLHRASEQNPLVCGEFDVDYGFQNMLAFFYAIERVNAGDFLLSPSVRLGGTVIDTCGSSVRISRDVASLLSGEGTCFLDRSVTDTRPVGFMATWNDDVAAVNSLNKVKPRVVVSPSAVASDLNTPLVLKTQESDKNEGKIMALISRQMSWAYVAVIDSSDRENSGVLEGFLTEATGTTQQFGLCVGANYTMPDDAEIGEALSIVGEIRRIHGLSVIVLFTNARDTTLLVNAVQNMQLSDRFTLIGSTTWADNRQKTLGAPVAETGSIVVQFFSRIVPGFIEYMESLTVSNHGIIPDDWFEELWQRTMKCRLENATKVMTSFPVPCSPDGRLVTAEIQQNPYVLHTIISTQMFALGLNGIRECVNARQGLAACLEQIPDSATVLANAMKSVEWKEQPALGLTEQLDFSFREDDGFGNLGFSIFNIDLDGTFVEIGRYKDGLLEFDKTRYRNYNSEGRLSSTDISQCPIGAVCECAYEIGVRDMGGRPYVDVTDQPSTMPVTNTEPKSLSVRTITLIALSGIGVVVSVVMLIYLLVAYPDRGGTSILGYLLLFSLGLIYASNLAFLLETSETTCAWRKFCQAYVHALCFSCMLIKVVITWEMAPSGYLASYSRMKHPAMLFIMAFGLSLVQAALSIEWILLGPSGIEIDEGGTISVCTPIGSYNRQLVISCVFVMLLILLTFVFSLITWECEDNSRESRWIMGSTCVVIITWVLWTSLTCFIELDMRDPLIVIVNLVNATVILLCMFVRKVHLLSKYNKEDSTDDIEFKKAPQVVEPVPAKQPRIKTALPTSGKPNQGGLTNAHLRLTDRGISGSVTSTEAYSGTPTINPPVAPTRPHRSYEDLNVRTDRLVSNNVRDPSDGRNRGRYVNISGQLNGGYMSIGEQSYEGRQTTSLNDVRTVTQVRQKPVRYTGEVTNKPKRDHEVLNIPPEVHSRPKYKPAFVPQGNTKTSSQVRVDGAHSSRVIQGSNGLVSARSKGGQTPKRPSIEPK